MHWLVGCQCHHRWSISSRTQWWCNPCLGWYPHHCSAYWLGPWAIILILEHFVFRHGKYNVDDWNTPSKLPIGWAALVSMGIGLAGVVLGAAQVVTLNGKEIPVVGPIAHLVNPPFGMDVGFELGLILAGIAYLILRRVELNVSRR